MGVRVPVGARIFSHHRIQTSSGAHIASYPMGTGAVFPGVKLLGSETDHSPPSSAEVTNVWSYTSTPQYVLMVWCLAKHREIFTLLTSLSHVIVKVKAYEGVSRSFRTKSITKYTLTKVNNC
jgi:hypothetical protein